MNTFGARLQATKTGLRLRKYQGQQGGEIRQMSIQFLSRVRLLFIFVGAGTVLLLAPSRAGAEDLMNTARNWGEIHGAAIYCRRKDSDAFGRKAMSWLRSRSGGAQFEKLRDTYGLRVIETARTPPTYAAGGSCTGFDAKYREAKARMGG